jgi:hypothetical protein
MAGALAGPVTAYVYDWNMLPIGQTLWLKELSSYIDYPPLQNPASYNLDQVIQQVRDTMRSVTQASSPRGAAKHLSGRPRGVRILHTIGSNGSKSDLVLMPSGRRNCRAQNSGCGFTAQSFYTARVKNSPPVRAAYVTHRCRHWLVKHIAGWR